MGERRPVLVLAVAVVLAAVWLAVRAVPAEELGPSTGRAAPPRAAATPPALVGAGTAVVDGRGALLQRPPAPVSVGWAPGQDCGPLGDARFVARCGTAGELVWVVESRQPGTGPGWRASVFRLAAGGGADLVLRTSESTGLGLQEVRASVADVSGDGVDDVVFAFYRLGAGDVLSVDVVQSPGAVTVHRDYPSGSARATRGQLEGWADVGEVGAGTSLLAHETLRVADGAWSLAALDTTPSDTVYARDFPDPFVLRAGSMYFAYATNASGSNVPVIRSDDLRTWSRLRDALPQLPPWSAPGRVWAPAVLPRPGGYVLYYATRNRATGQQCVSRAWSTVPEGPFVDDTTAGLVCQVDRGGSIDPSPFVDADGTAWLYWKSDGLPGVEGPRLWAQPLNADGLSLTGSAAPALGEDQSWETPVIEGPAMVRDGGRYYLFYVAGPWQTAGYAIGYAVCASPQGPCSKPQNGPLLASVGTLAGPGGPDFVVDTDGRRWMSFHGWSGADIGYPRGRRSLFLLPITFAEGRPILGSTAQ